MNTDIEVKDSQEHAIGRVVSFVINKDMEHTTVKIGKSTYQVKWPGFNRRDKTFELDGHIPNSRVVSYCKLIKRPLPENVNDAQMGWNSNRANSTEYNSFSKARITICTIAKSN